MDARWKSSLRDPPFLDVARPATRQRRSEDDTNDTVAAESGQRWRSGCGWQNDLFHTPTISRQQYQTLPGRHRANALEIRAERSRSGRVDRRFSRNQQVADAVEGPALLRHRSRWH